MMKFGSKLKNKCGGGEYYSFLTVKKEDSGNLKIKWTDSLKEDRFPTVLYWCIHGLNCPLSQPKKLYIYIY